MIVGLLHPGDMGAAVGARLVAAGHTVLWDPEGRSAESALRAQDAGFDSVNDLGGLLEAAEIVMSVSPAAAAEAIAADVARLGYRGLYVDCNAISPTRMIRIGARLGAVGAAVVDGSISGPPPSASPESTRIFLAGPGNDIDRVRALLTDGQLDTAVVGEMLGAASALKMATISYLRTARVLAAFAQATVDAHGVAAALDDEAARLGIPILSDRAALPGVAARAWRWGPEMHEVADTLAAAEMPTVLADATAQLFERLAAAEDDWAMAPDEVLDLLRERD